VLELERTVFVIPAAEFKGQRPHVLILNDVAARIVEECRGDHDEFVFVWRRERVKNIEDEPVRLAGFEPTTPWFVASHQAASG
jgi:hypothetical protein